MQIKNIEKLEELNTYRWKHASMNFGLEVKPSMTLYIKAYFFNGNEEIERDIMHRFTEKNLTELEFYGLKVVLNEKPKLTRKERDIVESIRSEFWLARDKSIDLYLSSGKPYPVTGYNHWRSGGINLKIDIELFPFITWESGKAWSKAELMELEVVN